MAIALQRVFVGVFCFYIASISRHCAAADETEAFHLAVSKGEQAKVEQMLSRNAPLANRRGETKLTPLFEAALHGHTAIAKLLLDRGAKVDDRVLGETPLFRACHGGHTETAALLIDRGADIDAACNQQTPLYIAIKRLHPGVVRLLVDRGVDPNWIPIHPHAPLLTKDKRTVPPLEALYGLRAAMRNVAVNKSRGDKEKLAYAEKMQNSAEEIVTMLLNHRDIKVDHKHPGGGGTALHAVAALGRVDLAKRLIELGADVNARTDRLVDAPVVLPPYNLTPLHVALEKGHREMVEFLLENGADSTAKDSRGKTAVGFSKNGRGIDKKRRSTD